ncbi:MAG: hypothetical protein NT120_00155, partial [Candidatus Aenigmarchaeota archaeon]|nr:hypothetical protein [Candidatus Aenigmarchaeota archaeon]
LYPESDIPAVGLDKKFLSSVETPRTLMEKQDEMIKQFTKQGMKENIAKALITYRTATSEEVKLIGEYAKLFKNVDVNLIAKMILEMPKEIKTRFKLDASKVEKQVYSTILDTLNKGGIPSDSVLYILVEHLTGQSIENAIGKYKIVTEKELKKIIKDVLSENKGKKESVLMGLIMQKVRGRVDGEAVVKMLREMI